MHSCFLKFFFIFYDSGLVFHQILLQMAYLVIDGLFSTIPG